MLNSYIYTWLLQRVTALLIAAYLIFFTSFLLLSSSMQYHTWLLLFQNKCMQIFTILFVVSVCWHAWIGLWIVMTDYIKCAYLRLFLAIIILLLFFVYITGTLQIFWGI